MSEFKVGMEVYAPIGTGLFKGVVEKIDDHYAPYHYHCLVRLIEGARVCFWFDSECLRTELKTKLKESNDAGG